ncbi:hypothetical protein BRD04_02165 [Halobacteriales archaeon QS_9_67_17]|nr:MAG: hypothetical protein BRD04_02165 [Halobacteriales archaeon QS_9_67_17]
MNAPSESTAASVSPGDGRTGTTLGQPTGGACHVEQRLREESVLVKRAEAVVERPVLIGDAPGRRPAVELEQREADGTDGDRHGDARDHPRERRVGEQPVRRDRGREVGTEDAAREQTDREGCSREPRPGREADEQQREADAVAEREPRGREQARERARGQVAEHDQRHRPHDQRRDEQSRVVDDVLENEDEQQAALLHRERPRRVDEQRRVAEQVLQRLAAHEADRADL